MTAKELIEYLCSIPPETRVLTRGYEGGYADVEIDEISVFAEDVNSAWYYGEHEKVTFDTDHVGYKRFMGVCL